MENSPVEDKNKLEFANILKTVFLGYGRNEPAKEVTQLWWNVFQNDSMEDVRVAFAQAVSESTEFLVPGVVRQYIPDRSGFLGPEEAWNQYPKSEQEPAWVYTEMMMAGNSCRNSIDRGDMVGARMAFLENYPRSIHSAKQEGSRPSWYYSDGIGLSRIEADQQKIRKTIEAREKQWISQDLAERVLMIADQSAPNPKILDMIRGGKMIKQIPSGSSTEDTPRIGTGNGT